MCKHKEALENYNKSLEIKIRVLGHEHPLVADTKHKCANLFFPLDPIFDSTTAAFQLGHFCSIALILKEQAKYDQAIKLGCENVADYEKCCGQDHVRVLAAKNLVTNSQKQQAASMDLPAGAHVRISGLISRPELNGQQGVVLLFDHKKARYGVRLADGKEMLLKPECLASTCCSG